MYNSKDLKSFSFIMCALLLFSLCMIYSASYAYAKETFNNSLHFLIKQAMFLCMSVGITWIISKSKFQFWFRYAFIIHIFFTLVLLLCFIPGISLELKGSQRWIRLGSFTLQPGEFIKYSTLFTTIHFFHYFSHWDIREKLLKACVLFFPMLLLLFQPDFGMFALCSMNILLVCFFSDLPRKFFYSIFLSSIIALLGLVTLAPYRMKRLMSYLDPWNDPMNSGFQVIQSFIAFALGGFWGVGVGGSKEKLFYLPEAHNDFIFSVIGEELGLVGSFGLILLFLSFIYFGLRLSLSIKDKNKSLFAVISICSISFQAILNMGVVLGLLPTKGLNLPFVSYGGSSLLANSLLLGLFFSVICKDESIPNQFSETA